MGQPQSTMNPCSPLPKRVRLQSQPGVRFVYSYSTAPTSNSLRDIQHHEDVVNGLSQLDAYCNLVRLIRRKGRYLHLIDECRRIN